jgi:urease subunit alpha
LGHATGRDRLLLSVADDYDVQVMITPTPQRVGLRRGHHQSIQGPHHPRFPHRGCGRWLAPGIIKVAGLKNVLPSSTNPTRPFTKDTIDEHLDMPVAATT